MGKGAYILGGALQGIGAGIMEQAKVNQEREQANATQRFQAYLANQSADRADARSAQENKWNLERDEKQAGYRADQAERDAEATLARDRLLHANERDLEGLKNSNAQALARLNSNLRMTEDQKRIAADLAADVSRMGYEIGHTEITKDGSIVIYSKSGTRLRMSAPGQFNPKATGEDGGGLLGGRDGVASASPAPPPAKVPTKPVPAPAAKPHTAPLRSLDDIFGGATPGVTSTLTNTYSR